jgi:hypothetical protein
MSAINKRFNTRLRKSPNKGGWTYIVWPTSTKFFRTRGIVKVSGTIDGHAFRSAFMARGDGTHMLPVKASLRKAIEKGAGQTVDVHLTARIPAQRLNRHRRHEGT